MPKSFLQPEYLIIGAYLLVLSVLAFLFNGTGDDGDSLHHFLYAQEAFRHPENFFNHWAKPVYVMFMAPWAQLGFIGVKLANVVCIALSMFFTVKIADLMDLKPRYLPLLFMVAAPIAVFWVLSGLTEPLFVCWLTFGLLLAFQNRLTFASVWLSFLPFVRSEGLIVLVVFAVYLLLKKHWKLVPMLAAGHLAFSIVGYPVHKDLMWVFNLNPYATIDSSSGYGAGRWTHYLVHFHEVYGPFVALFLAAALLFGLYRLIRFLREKTTFSKAEIWLVYGVFTAYFVGHTIFWANGMFKSYGLMRVMLGVLPLVALICARLAEGILLRLQGKAIRLGLAGIYLALAGWGMTQHQNWGLNLSLSGSQIAHEALVNKYGATIMDGNYTVYVDAIHPAVAMGLDIFSKKKRPTTRLYDGSPVAARSAVIWDNRFARIDAQLPLEKLRTDARLMLVDSFLDYEQYGVYLFFTTDSFARYANVLVWSDYEEAGREGVVPGTGQDSSQVLQLNQQHQFSDGLSAPVSDFVGRENVLVQFDALAPEMPENYAGVVVSIESKAGKMLEYTLYPVRELGLKAGNWQKISKSFKLETEQFPDAEVKIYLWNPTATPLFIDNLKMEFEE